MKHLLLLLKILFFVIFVNKLYSQNNSVDSNVKSQQNKKIELSEEDKKLKKIIEDVNSKNNSKEPTIYGTNSSSIDESGVNFKNYKGKDYSEVAKAKNWSPFAVPDNIEEQYEEYYREKMIKNILLISLGIFLIITTTVIFIKKRKNIKSDKSLSEAESSLKEKIRQINVAYENGVLTKQEFDEKIKKLTE